MCRGAEDPGVPPFSGRIPRFPAEGSVFTGRRRRPVGAGPPHPHDMPSLLKAMRESLETSPTALGSFLRSWLKAGSSHRSQAGLTRGSARAGRRAGMFPCLIPKVLPSWGEGETVDPRWRAEIDAFLVILIGVSSFASAGRFAALPAHLRPGDSAAHQSMMGSVRARLLAFVRLGSNLEVRGAPRTGRKGPVIDAVLTQLRAVSPGTVRTTARAPCASQCYALRSVPLEFTREGRVAEVAKTAIRPLVASRLSFPAKSAFFDVSEYLHGAVRDAYLKPATIRKRDPPASPSPQGKGVRAAKGQWEAFLHRVDASGGLELVSEEEGPHDAFGTSTHAGFFAIHKSQESDRTVTNRIPQNSQEQALGLSGRLMAHGVCLIDLQLRRGEKARVSGRDLPDCYHSCRVSFARACTNATGPLLPASLFEGGRAYRLLVQRCRRRGSAVPEFVRAAWRSLPMGDLNAVCFVQAAHTNLLRRAGALRDGVLVRYCAVLPRGKLFAGIVVDDLCIIAVVPRSLARATPAEDSSELAIADAAYARAKLPPKEEKCFQSEDVHDVWGATVDGEGGSVRAGLQGILRTVCFLLSLLADGRATPGALRAVLGTVVYAAMYRRAAFSLLSAVFWEAIDRPDGVIFPLSHVARVELELAMAFMPLMATNIRAEVSSCIWATDASSRSAACVSTEVHSEAAREFWRHRAKKRGGDALLTLVEQFEKLAGEDANAAEILAEARRILGEPDTALDPEDSSASPDAPPTWTAAVADSVGWRPVFRYSCRPGEHINRKEARPIRTLVRRLALSVAAHGTRQFTLVDSSVNVCSWTKGRSRAVALNEILRSVVPEQLMCDIQMGFGHIRSAFNPADAPTRGRPVRTVPAVDVPSDPVASLLRGDVGPETDDLFGDFAHPLPECVEPCREPEPFAHVPALH